jgi:hypothetical protein
MTLPEQIWLAEDRYREQAAVAWVAQRLMWERRLRAVNADGDAEDAENGPERSAA